MPSNMSFHMIINFEVQQPCSSNKNKIIHALRRQITLHCYSLFPNTNALILILKTSPPYATDSFFSVELFLCVDCFLPTGHSTLNNCLSPFFLSIHSLQLKFHTSCVFWSVIVTLSQCQLAPTPLLSCSIMILDTPPRLLHSRSKVEVTFRSNKFSPAFTRARLPVSPVLPNMVMKTLASVPAPNLSPVSTLTRYNVMSAKN